MKRLALLAFIWGWSFLFIKVAVEGMTPPTVAAARVGLGALVLYVVLRARGGSLPRSPRLWRDATVAAVFGSVVPFTLLAWGEERITSALTAVLNASTPLFTAVAAGLLLRDRLKPVQAIGLVVGLAGVGVAAGLGGEDLAHSSLWGSMASVGAGACYGIAFAWMRRHLTGVAPLCASTTQLIAATVLLAPFALATSIGPGIQLTPRRLGAVVLLGSLGTGLAYVLNYRVIADVGATKASLVTYLIPIVAVVVGVVVLDEPFSSRLLFGGLLIVAGIAVVNEQLLTRRNLPAPAAGTGLVLLVVALIGVGVGACGGDDDESSGRATACDAVQHETLDPDSVVHVLPGAAEPMYLSDPPTSGPHQPGRRLSGVIDEPIARPLQVGALEAGQVLIQHRDLTERDRAELAVLASDEVVVAPNPDLPAPLVATAWLVKQECSEVDVESLERFVADHVGQGPGTD